MAEVKKEGKVTSIRGFVYPHRIGCYAYVVLYPLSTPPTEVMVITSDLRLQSLLETALITGYLISFDGEELANPPTISGLTRKEPVYGLNAVEVLNQKP